MRKSRCFISRGSRWVGGGDHPPRPLESLTTLELTAVSSNCTTSTTGTMRAGSRLLAAVKQAQYLRAGEPTGLTGLFTHSAPRSTLIYTYHNTLEKLKAFPESSVYRQSLEALTKHRLQIVESVKPDGLEAWQQRIQEKVKAFPEAFKEVGSQANKSETNIVYKAWALEGMSTGSWEDEPVGKPELEGVRTMKERDDQAEQLGRDLGMESARIPRIEPEPALTAEQVVEMEQQIGAGLIEEVIQVAEGENKLVDEMLKNKVWEDLEEKPVEGQWDYAERNAHTSTQAR
ncbi:hypothetical protein M8818_003608 [Zalaria obscura]|uniref:Uncharacterized protein n=1 Tax=Zalaria obscura TaxID=2024903 RepID=A0ACC3SE68_9PEZI